MQLVDNLKHLHSLDEDIERDEFNLNELKAERDKLALQCLEAFGEAGIASLDVPETGHRFEPSEKIYPKWSDEYKDTDLRMAFLRDIGEGELITVKEGFNANTLAARCREWDREDSWPDGADGILTVSRVFDLKKLKSKK